MLEGQNKDQQGQEEGEGGWWWGKIPMLGRSKQQGSPTDWMLLGFREQVGGYLLRGEGCERARLEGCQEQPLSGPFPALHSFSLSLLVLTCLH